MTICRNSLVPLFFLIVFAGCGDEKTAPRQNYADYDELPALKEQVKKYPDSMVLVQELIEAYRNRGKYDSAIKLTRQQIGKDSGNAYFFNILATLYFEDKDTVKAINALQAAIDIYPLPDYLSALGTIYAQIKDPRSLQIADELLYTDHDKNEKNGYFIKGFYYNYINRYDSAIIYMDSALQLDYTFMYAYREKAIALYSQKKYEEAIGVLERAVTLQNNFDEGYFWMGKSFEKLKDTAKAVISYQNALLYDKNYQEAREALEKLNQ